MCPYYNIMVYCKTVFQKGEGMMIRAYRPISYCLLLLVVMFLIYGCAKESSDDIVAIQINDYKMSAREFKDTFMDENTASEDTAENRRAFLHNFINRK